MRKTTRVWIASLTVSAALAGVSIATAQDPTATPLPVKATVEATEAPLDVTAEATVEAGIEATAEAIVETPISDLTYNTPVVGVVGDGEGGQDWPLPMTSADRLMVVVERLDGNLIPGVVILNDAGDEVATSYGAQDDGATAVIDNVAIAEPGDYTVRVGSERFDGLTTGHFSLTVLPLGIAVDSAPNTEIIGEIGYDTPVEGTITPEHWYQQYTLTTDAADSMRVVAERTGGSLEPLVYVIGPDGSTVATGYPENTGDIAMTSRVDLPAAGAYTIVVTRSREIDGPTQGGYRLTAELWGAGESSASLSESAGEVVYGEALEGEITPAQWYQDWTLTVDAGDTISLFVQRADDANLQPEVAVLGGSGQEIFRGYTSDTGDSALVERRTLEGPGEYTVRVNRRQGQTGVTSGAYTLTVELIGSGEGSAALAGTTGDVTFGEPVEGEITNTRWADSWTVNATAGERILVTVERTDGTLIPRVQMRDRNGQPLSDGYPENTGDVATLQYNPPSTGEFVIVVMREREQEGVTTGSYRLTVAPVE